MPLKNFFLQINCASLWKLFNFWNFQRQISYNHYIGTESLIIKFLFKKVMQHRGAPGNQQSLYHSCTLAKGDNGVICIFFYLCTLKNSKQTSNLKHIWKSSEKNKFSHIIQWNSTRKRSFLKNFSWNDNESCDF